MEVISLKIHKTSDSGKSRLRLEGTVLIVEDKDKFIETETQIPVELISISQGKRFLGKKLRKALLLPVGSVPLLAISSPFNEYLGVSDDSIYVTIHSIVFLLIILLSVVLFFIYLVRFFIKVKTVSFVIAPDGFEIEFWKSKKDSQKVDELIEQIQQKQALVEKPFEYPATNSIYTSKYAPVLRIIIIIFLSTIPASITENVYLFFLVLLPVTWFAYKGVQYIKQPAKYRKAMSFYIQKKYDDAISLLTQLKEDCPEYIPAYTLLVGIYIRTKRFDDAFSTVASLPHDYNEMSQDIHADIWYFKRLYERRISTVT